MPMIINLRTIFKLNICKYTHFRHNNQGVLHFFDRTFGVRQHLTIYILKEAHPNRGALPLISFTISNHHQKCYYYFQQHRHQRA